MAINPLCTPDLSVKSGKFVAEVAPIRCKRWSCPVCAEANRRKVIAIAMAAKPQAMLTLTVSSKHYATPEAAAEALKRGLRLLRLDLKRDARLQNFSFLAVFERHKSGYPHLHLLIRGKYLPWQRLRTVWERITGSTHIDIRRISSRGLAAFYVAKYIGKDLAAFEGCKRWWRSHDYSAEVEDVWRPDYSLGRPTRMLADAIKVARWLTLIGWTVEYQKSGRFRALRPPGDDTPIEWLIAQAEGRVSPAVLKRGRA